MANPNRGQVALTAGDREYKLVFSVNSLCDLEAELDQPIAAIIATIQNPEKVRLKFIRALVWAGLQENHEDVSILDAGRIVSDMGIQPAMNAVGEAFKLAFPDAPKGENAKGNPQKAKA